MPPHACSSIYYGSPCPDIRPGHAVWQRSGAAFRPDQQTNGAIGALVFHLFDGDHLGHIVAQHVFDPMLQRGP